MIKIVIYLKRFINQAAIGGSFLGFRISNQGRTRVGDTCEWKKKRIHVYGGIQKGDAEGCPGTIFSEEAPKKERRK